MSEVFADLAPFGVDNGPVYAVAFSPDGDMVASAGEDGEVCLRDARTGADLGWLVSDNEAVWSMAFSPDGTELVIGDADGSVRVWDPREREERSPLAEDIGLVLSVSFESDGAVLAVGTEDGTLTVLTHSVSSGTLRFHSGTEVVSAALSRDGALLAVGGRDGLVQAWYVQTGDLRSGFSSGSTGPAGPIQAVAISPDGGLLVGGDIGGSVLRWDARTGGELGSLQLDVGAVQSVAFSPDGKLLAVAGSAGSVCLYDLDVGQQRGALLVGHEGWVSSVAFSPDGTTLATGGGQDGTVRLWDVNTGQQRGGPRPIGVRALAFSHDGSVLAGVGADGSVRLWDAPLMARHVQPAEQDNPVTSVAFSADDTLLVGGGADGFLTVWDVRTGELRDRRYTSEFGPVLAVGFGRSGDALALSVQHGMARVWTGDGGWDLVASNPGPGSVEVAAFRPGGTALALGTSDGTVWTSPVYERDSNPHSIVIHAHAGPVQSVAFGPKGDVLATGGNDGTVRLWDATTGSQRAESGSHTGPVNSLAFGPNDDELASGGSDGLVRLRDDSGVQRPTLIGHVGPVRAVAFSPDGRIVASGGDDAVRIWEPLGGSQIGMFGFAYPAAGQLRARSAPEQSGASQPTAATLGNVIPFPAPVRTLLGGGYDADAADDPRRGDALGFDDDVRMLCSVLADKTAQPPLSVGLFGEWGSGKSFFMRLMRQRIVGLAGAAREAEAAEQETRYCAHVVQITFNAWHYMDANLWASLAAEIFFRLATPDADAVAEEQARVERQREAILQRLDTCQQLAAELTETRMHAETQRRHIEEQLDQAQRQRQKKVAELAAAVGVDVAKQLAADPELAGLRDKAAQDLGLSALAPLELPGLVGDLRKLSGLAGAAWRLLAKPRGGWAWVFGLAAVFLVSLLIGLVLLTARGGQWHGWVAIGVTLASLGGFTARIRPVLTAVGDGLDQAEKALQREETLVQQFRAQQTAERVRLEAELERLTAQEQNLTVQLAAAAVAEAEARSEERDLRADRRLRKFLEERSGSSDYQGQLGLISLLHKDFRRLDTLLRMARESTEGELPRIDRIILYIDDLDRCPPARVVEVLQAIHLLLALPLFVVVVGVDPRWLFGSLQRHYHALLQPQASGQAADGDLLHWTSTPQDYLEKIFQIPFALMPMTSGGFAQLVSDLAGEPAAPPDLDGPRETTPATGEAALATGDTALAIAADHDQPPGLPDRLTADAAEAPVPIASSTTSEGAGGPEPGGPEPQEAGHDLVAHVLPGADGYEPVLPDDSGQPPQQDHAVPPGRSGTDSLASAEEQRIQVREGSAASASSGGIDPNPVGLRLTAPEIRFIQALAPMVTTPRVSTRLVNVYRMIRSTQATGGPSRFLDLSTGTGDYQAILVLLAIVSGFPDLAASTFEALLRADPDLTWPVFVGGLLARESEREVPGAAQPGDWARMGEALAAVQDNAQVPDGLSAYREWAPRVARFSFAAGHLLASSATS